MIMDNLRAQHSKEVIAWLEEHQGRIAVFHLPSYAPELNPDERHIARLKHELRSRVPERTKPKLLAASTHIMRMLANSKAAIRSIIQNPVVR